ncbi:MAG TPA: ribonuclease D [Vitreimonas sp.]|uniref:ribonuclease D n=1 Tax=Vitreimonas sp. TaxID=3069702 RepID=UPI002D25434B|nr:ribonuclease D [Vitreimonas sp.]HYD87812.1 ribonuclease D [Vitreimonas sp.]
MTRKLSLTVDGKDGRNVAVYLHKGDLPDSVTFSGPIAVDSETMGLSLIRDPLCLVQLSDGGHEAHLVQLDRASYDAPNLKRVLSDPNVLKLFHFARFDVAMFMRDLSVITTPIYCTKIASKLVRTYTDRHGLKDLTKEVLGRDISKDQQSSDWGAAELSDAQLAYAASDVLHLHQLKERLDAMLFREGRVEVAQSCFDFLPTRAALDLAGWEETDIFAHS